MQCIVAYCYKYTTYDLFCGPGLHIDSLWNLLAIRVNIFLFQFFPQCILSLFAHMPKKKHRLKCYILCIILHLKVEGEGCMKKEDQLIIILTSL